jgi:hypothetical protein
MIGLLCFALAALDSPFKSKLRLEAENAVLRDKRDHENPFLDFCISARQVYSDAVLTSAEVSHAVPDPATVAIAHALQHS